MSPPAGGGDARAEPLHMARLGPVEQKGGEGEQGEEQAAFSLPVGRVFRAGRETLLPENGDAGEVDEAQPADQQEQAEQGVERPAGQNSGAEWAAALGRHRRA